MSYRTLDLNELADEWQGLVDEREELQESEDEPMMHADLCADLDAEMEKYVSLCGELGITPADPDTLRWYEREHGEAFIADADFQDYAQALAEDIGAVPQEYSWPTSCIDWEKAADELRQDYTSITYDGEDWLTR